MDKDKQGAKRLIDRKGDGENRYMCIYIEREICISIYTKRLRGREREIERVGARVILLYRTDNRESKSHRDR